MVDICKNIDIVCFGMPWKDWTREFVFGAFRGMDKYKNRLRLDVHNELGEGAVCGIFWVYYIPYIAGGCSKGNYVHVATNVIVYVLQQM